MTPYTNHCKQSTPNDCQVEDWLKRISVSFPLQGSIFNDTGMTAILVFGNDWYLRGPSACSSLINTFRAFGYWVKGVFILDNTTSGLAFIISRKKVFGCTSDLFSANKVLTIGYYPIHIHTKVNGVCILL